MPGLWLCCPGVEMLLPSALPLVYVWGDGDVLLRANNWTQRLEHGPACPLSLSGEPGTTWSRLQLQREARPRPSNSWAQVPGAGREAEPLQ